MDKFKSTIQKRIRILTCLIIFSIALLAIIAVLHRFVLDSPMNDFIRGYQIGVFIGFLSVILYTVFKYSKALKNEATLKELYIKETDERVQLIVLKSGSTSLVIIYMTLCIATIIAGFFNTTVFITLGCVLIFSLLLKVFSELYYKKKL